DLADVDARDPHRRLRLERGRVLEGGVELVARAGEGDSLRERQVGRDREEDHQEEADLRRARTAVAAAEDARIGRLLPGLVADRAAPLSTEDAHPPFNCSGI